MYIYMYYVCITYIYTYIIYYVVYSRIYIYIYTIYSYAHIRIQFAYTLNLIMNGPRIEIETQILKNTGQTDRQKKKIQKRLYK